jgi:hypothetical protein
MMQHIPGDITGVSSTPAQHVVAESATRGVEPSTALQVRSVSKSDRLPMYQCSISGRGGLLY